MCFQTHFRNFSASVIIVCLSGFAIALSSCKNDPEKTPIASNMPKVADGYSVKVVSAPGMVDFPMFSTLDETGRLFVFESIGSVYDKSEEAIANPQFRIKLLEDNNGDGVYDKSTIFADKIGFPQGGVFYKGSLYASSAPDLLKLTDTDGDGVADKREVILSGWVLNVNANSLVGPFMGPDGWLYLTNAIMGFDVKTKEGKQLKGETARIWRLRPDGSDLEWISAGGMNNPVELTFTEAAEPIGTETYFTDPKAGERDALVYWTEGGVYPKPNSNVDRDGLARTGELMPVVSKYSRVSPAGIGRYRSTILGDDFKDNLFSAQFNTHRVIRHKLIRDGASFRTEDEVFFSSDSNEDFHPTDVLEDADGSLLIVETGGWFIKGCPLSQVSKPELKGAIYRVVKNNAAKTDDPYGNSIAWTTIDAASAGKYLEDQRPFVSDRAQQLLVDKGAEGVKSLSELLSHSKSVTARTKAVFALYRIGTTEALQLVRTKGLEDADVQVRIAAARSVGLAKDKQASAKLKQLILKDEPAVKRQAATALGQIGEVGTVPELLSSADGIEDRFIRHAIIYSLITLNAPVPVQQALANPSPFIQEAALIALDQMDASTLKAENITAFLMSGNQSLRKTALWVASHHPDWSGEMIAFLNKRFSNGPLSPEEKKLFGDLLLSFSKKPDMQRFIAQSLNNLGKEYKLFFLDAMAKSHIKEFPALWTEQLSRQLSPSTDPEVKARAIDIAGLRGISTLSNRLKEVAADKNNPAELRTDAIAVLLKNNPQISAEHFNFLYSQLITATEAPIRQKAAYVLAQGKLSEDQLSKLATDFLPSADAFILPRIVPLFTGAHGSEIGRTLAVTLTKSTSLDGFTSDQLTKVFEKYPDDIKPAVSQLMAKLNDVRGERLKRLDVFESQISNGVMASGRKLFFGKAVCSTCHTIGSQGGHFGPDLTSIQRDRSAHDLLEAIVYPSSSFVREFETYKIKTATAEHTGILKERTPDMLVLNESPDNAVRIARSDIKSTEIVNVSMMPQGLDKLLSPQEMSDLMTFLLGQDQDPETDQKILR